MRIVESETWRTDFLLREPYTIAYETYDAATNFFVRIRDDKPATSATVENPSTISFVVFAESPSSIIALDRCEVGHSLHRWSRQGLPVHHKWKHKDR